MPINRFFSPALSQTLEGEEHHHLSRVMRVALGETVELVDGKGHLAKARVEKIDKHQTTLHIESTIHVPRSSPFIYLAPPFMRPSKLEWVIEKGTELGADAFFLYVADHSEKEVLTETQMERLRNLSIAAMKQSGRLYLPSFEVVSSLDELLKKEASIYFGDTSQDAPWIAPAKENTLFISGPEKGFSSREITKLQGKGAGIKLSQYILRAETAPIAALSIFRIP